MELIKIQKSNGGKDVVSSKELHTYLETSTRFDIWIQRMSEYGFIENSDYQCLYKNVQMPNGGSKRVLDDVVITIDMAKEISMIQRTEKGKQARQYFIECERKLKQVSIPQTYAEALLEAGRLAMELEQKQMLLEEQAPKVENYDLLMASDDCIDFSGFSKVLNNGLGRNKLFRLLRDKKILMDSNMPYQKYINQGLFKVIEYNLEHNNKIGFKCLITTKGQEYLINLLKQNK